MYMNQLMAICKADNGYVITVTVPMKEDSSSSPTAVGSSREKTFVCYDEDTLLTKISAILPLLTAPDAEEQMEQIFEEAASND